tara:strand:- start:107 stop:364 length:258 start_codon:yes stop_codon:yes gene_type:complete
MERSVDSREEEESEEGEDRKMETESKRKRETERERVTERERERESEIEGYLAIYLIVPNLAAISHRCANNNQNTLVKRQQHSREK